MELKLDPAGRREYFPRDMLRDGIGKVVFFVLLCATLVSCAPRPDLRGPAALPEAYEKELLAWTVSGHFFVELDRQIEVFATLFSPTFRRAFREHFRTVFAYPLEEGRGDLEKKIILSGEGPAVFLAVDFSDQRWVDLSSPDAVWKVLLQEEGDSDPKPARVEMIDAPAPNLRAFFPYVGEFSRCFWVRPSAVAGEASGRPPTAMLLTSAFGKLELSWKREK